jgi:hypothetical protein
MLSKCHCGCYESDHPHLEPMFRGHIYCLGHWHQNNGYFIYFILHRLAFWSSGPFRYYTMFPSHSIASQSNSIFKHTILTRSTGKSSSISSPQVDRRTFYIGLFFITCSTGRFSLYCIFHHVRGGQDGQGRQATILQVFALDKISRPGLPFSDCINADLKQEPQPAGQRNGTLHRIPEKSIVFSRQGEQTAPRFLGRSLAPAPRGRRE